LFKCISKVVRDLRQLHTAKVFAVMMSPRTRNTVLNQDAMRTMTAIFDPPIALECGKYLRRFRHDLF